MALPKFIKLNDRWNVRTIVTDPQQNLDHTSQDNRRLANAVIFQAVKDLQSKSADIYGPAWDFLTGRTKEDKIVRAFWAGNAQVDEQILHEWAHEFETEYIKARNRSAVCSN